MDSEGFKDSKDAEYWHGKSLELAVSFLPSDAPVVKHIVSSYQKHHSPAYQQIPENEEFNSDVKIVKPLKGVQHSKIAPCIQDVKITTIKLNMLDIAPNDYLEGFFDEENDQ